MQTVENFFHARTQDRLYYIQSYDVLEKCPNAIRGERRSVRAISPTSSVPSSDIGLHQATSDCSNPRSRHNGDDTHPSIFVDEPRVGKFSTWCDHLNKDIPERRFNRGPRRSRNLDIWIRVGRCLTGEDFFARSRSQDGRGYISVGHGYTLVDTYLCRRRKNGRGGRSDADEIVSHDSNRLISGAGQYRPFSTVREHSTSRDNGTEWATAA